MALLVFKARCFGSSLLWCRCLKSGGAWCGFKPFVSQGDTLGFEFPPDWVAARGVGEKVYGRIVPQPPLPASLLASLLGLA